MRQQIVEAMKKMVGKSLIFINLFCSITGSVMISPKNQNYYVGGTALVEFNLRADEEIISHDPRLVLIDKLIINKFINGQFVKNNLYRYEVVLKNAGKLELEPFAIQASQGSKKIQIDVIDVNASPQELSSVGARLTADHYQALVGQKVNLVYEVLCDYDHQIINYEIPEFSKNVEILKQSETKNGNKVKLDFQLVFKAQGNYKIGKMVVASAKNGPLSQLLGFGKTFASNELNLEILETKDIFLFKEKPEELAISINSQIGESEILTIKSSNYFLSWPQVKLLSGKANIYNSEIKNGPDYSLCQFVIQPLENGPLSIEIFGKVYDLQADKYHDLACQRNLVVDLKYKNQVGSEKPQLSNQQLSKKNFRQIISKLVYQAIDWQLWYISIIMLVFLNLYLIYFHQQFQSVILSLKTRLLFKYYAFLFNLASKKNNLVKARMIAKKLLDLDMADQNFLNTLKQILYNS
jgi:hypothetical protein